MIKTQNTKPFIKKICLILILQIVYFNIFSANYYVDPTSGNISNTGTFSNPWNTLEAVMNTSFVFSPGDTIFLRTGNHGFPKINGINAGLVYIAPQIGETPFMDRIYIGNVSATSNWKLSGVTVQTENIAVYPISLITLHAATSNITIENCTVQSINNTSSYTRNDWRDKTNHGIRSLGSNHTIIGNNIKNIAVGLSIESENTLIKDNIVQYFTIDGVRGLASFCSYDGNTIKDNIAVFTYAENHYDGFQSYTCCPVGADTLKDVVLKNNLVINCTDSTRQWRGPMQGIAGFDGFFENWTIENNIVITDHWHGITLAGAINCKIINNTVVDPYDISPIDPFDSQSTGNPGPTWIKIAAHKNGSPSYGNTIQNNLIADLQNDVGIGTVNFNTVIGSSSNYALHFVDYQNFDFHLISTSTAIDSGTVNFAPLTDFEGSARPNGTGIDNGAYEFDQSTTVPNDTIVIIDTVFINDTIIINDTLSIIDTLIVNDTLILNDTTLVTDTLILNDTIQQNDTIIIYDTLILAVSKVTNYHELKLYPNPVENLLTLTGNSSELLTVEIYNSLGQNVTNRTRLRLNLESKKVFDFSFLEKGIYFIRTNTSSKVFYKL